MALNMKYVEKDYEELLRLLNKQTTNRKQDKADLEILLTSKSRIRKHR